MRFAYLLLLVPLSLTAGCSTLIAKSGQDLRELTTKEKVHSSLGEPALAGTKDGTSFEEYHTRRKISESSTARVYALGMGFVMSYGALELFALPNELYLLGSRTLCGQNLRVTYDRKGNVCGFSLDGEPLCSHLFGGPAGETSPDNAALTPAPATPPSAIAPPPAQ